MAKLDIFNPVWLDVVFTGRNQSYGAYVLRKNNAKTTNKALIIGVIFFALAIASPLIYGMVKGLLNKDEEEEDRIIQTEVVLASPPPVDRNEPPPPPAAEPPRPKVDQVKFPPPVVVPEAEADEEPPTIAKLEVADPGQKDIKGDAEKGVDNIEGPAGEAPPTQQAAIVEDNGVYDQANIEVQPDYPGGIDKFREFLGKNYVYPSAASEAGVSGRVIVQFVVEKDGSLTDIKVVRDLGYGTGDEAIRVIKKSKRWNPGIQNGRPVRVNYTIPFALQAPAE